MEATIFMALQIGTQGFFAPISGVMSYGPPLITVFWPALQVVHNFSHQQHPYIGLFPFLVILPHFSFGGMIHPAAPS